MGDHLLPQPREDLPLLLQQEDLLLLPQPDAHLPRLPAPAHPLLLLLQTFPEDCPSPPLPLLPPLPPRDLLPHSQQWFQLCKQCLQFQANQWQQVSLPLLLYLTLCRCRPCHLLLLRISLAYSPQLTSSVNQSVCLC